MKTTIKAIIQSLESIVSKLYKQSSAILSFMFMYRSLVSAI